MRFCLTVAMCPPEELIPLARAAEECGFDGVAVPDSVFFPKEVSADYPYTADGSRFWDAETPFADPFIAVSAMAAATSSIRFVTNVVKLPLRHPLLVAKQLTTFDSMFPGRLALGVGLSWIPEEFEWLDLSMAARGRRLDESIDVLRACFAGGWVEYHGELFDFGPLRISPEAARPLTVLVGGHSEPALRRAALRGDGWVSAMVNEDDATQFASRLRELRAANGLSMDGFEIVLTPMVPPDPDAFGRLADAGATEVIVGPWFFDGSSDLDAKLVSIERFAERVIVSMGKEAS